MEKNTVKILNYWTDGSYTNNIIGFGVAWKLSETEWTTHAGIVTGKGLLPVDVLDSRQIGGECAAVLWAVDRAIKVGADKVVIHYDYEGVSQWFAGEWKTNKDFTKKYVEIMNQYAKKIQIQFKWVKGHSDNIGNDLADSAASAIIRAEMERGNINVKPEDIKQEFHFTVHLNGKKVYRLLCDDLNEQEEYENLYRREHSYPAIYNLWRSRHPKSTKTKKNNVPNI